MNDFISRPTAFNIDEDIFIPLKEINELRREMINKLNEKRMYKINYIKSNYSIDVPNFEKERFDSFYRGRL